MTAVIAVLVAWIVAGIALLVYGLDVEVDAEFIIVMAYGGGCGVLGAILGLLSRMED